MSIALMTEAWKSSIASGPKMVLLSLCDNANDQGECYPSISTIAERCSMSERAVQGHISSLQKMHIVRRVQRSGRSTIYHIDPRRICTPAESAPPQTLHPTPAESAPPPPQNLHPTPAESAPITVNEPSIEPSLNRHKTLPRPDDVSESVWADFLLIRKSKKSVLTKTALDGMRSEAEKAGLSMDQALAMCCTRGWQSFKAEWVKPDNKAINPADIARVTVAGTKDPDPALVKIIQGNAKAVPPPEYIRKRMSQLLKGRA
jgi:DNA-binding transcriptional ArsR family regulator